MRNLVILFILLIFTTCKKDNDIIYKYYNSEIFSGNNSQIYGKWEYLYTVQHDSWAGNDTKMYLDLSYLNIKPIGSFERLKTSAIRTWEKGEIEIIGTFHDHLLVRFCPDSTDCGEPREIFVTQNDNLVITNANNSGGGRDDLYKRIK